MSWCQDSWIESRRCMVRVVPFGLFASHWVVRTIKVYRKNGYLYADNLKLTEYLPGLFFTSTGEAADFRGPVLMLASIKGEKVR